MLTQSPILIAILCKSIELHLLRTWRISKQRQKEQYACRVALLYTSWYPVKQTLKYDLWRSTMKEALLWHNRSKHVTSCVIRLSKQKLAEFCKHLFALSPYISFKICSMRGSLYKNMLTCSNACPPAKLCIPWDGIHSASSGAVTALSTNILDAPACNVAVHYQYFGERWCLDLQDIRNLVPVYPTSRHHISADFNIK
jgi:hypothetical protein